MNPLRPLVHIVGFQSVHPTILQMTLESNFAKESKSFKSYNIQSYEFYESSKETQPVIYT